MQNNPNNILHSLWRWTKKNFFTLIMVMVTLLLLFNPDAKALAIKGLIKTGLMGSPEIANTTPDTFTDLSNVTFKGLDGNSISLGDLKGKVVFINFWATWCAPCRAEMPTISALAKAFSADTSVVFIMVNVDGDLKASAKYFKKKNINLPAYKATSVLPPALQSSSIPATYVIDRAGQVKMRYAGAADYANENFIQAFRAFVKQ